MRKCEVKHMTWFHSLSKEKRAVTETVRKVHNKREDYIKIFCPLCPNVFCCHVLHQSERFTLPTRRGLLFHSKGHACANSRSDQTIRTMQRDKFEPQHSRTKRERVRLCGVRERQGRKCQVIQTVMLTVDELNYRVQHKAKRKAFWLTLLLWLVKHKDYDSFLHVFSRLTFSAAWLSLLYIAISSVFSVSWSPLAPPTPLTTT